MTFKRITFDDALQETEGGVRNLLLGNGFSIAFDDKFSFDNLKITAEDQSFLGQDVLDIFSKLETSDFEEVSGWLDKTLEALPDNIVNKYPSLADDLLELRANLQNGFMDVLKYIHPSYPSCTPYTCSNSCISPEQYASCLKFLENFKDGNVYSLNYDLLLYWTHMESMNSSVLNFKDGFGRGDGGRLVWREDRYGQGSQNIHYMHGAFHIVKDGGDVEKISASGERGTILDRLSSLNKIPLYVSEGDSEKKRKIIKNNEYLDYCLTSLSEQSGSLFVYGFSANRRDKHILEAIQKSKINKIYLGVRGDIDDGRYENLFDSFNSISSRRDADNGLELFCYSARDINPWTSFCDES